MSSIKPVLGGPGDLINAARLTFLPPAEFLADLWRMEVMLRRLDQNPAHVGVPALGDGAFAANRLAAGMFTRQQSKIGHQMGGMSKALEISEFAQEQRGREDLEAAHAHQRLDRWPQPPFLCQDLDLPRQALHALACGADILQILTRSLPLVSPCGRTLRSVHL